MKEIDAKGLACPTPVLLAKAAIENDGNDRVRITVDNKPARENLTLFFESKQFTVETEEKEGMYILTASGDAASTSPPVSAPVFSKEKTEDHPEKIVVMVTADRMGRGDDELGQKLMVNFINTLPEMGLALWRLIFVNSGVKMSITSSAVLPKLKAMEEEGLTILVCGTCLDHFNLLEEKEAGVTTNMLDIVTALQLADKVINI